MGREKFKHLLEPTEVGGVKLRNHLVMAPMATNLASVDGYVTEDLKAYYEARAKGGVGLIIIEYTCIDSPIGKGVARQLCCDDDQFIPGLSSLVHTIRKHRAAVALQICHAGRLALKRFTGCQPVAPSPLAAPGADMPRELTVSEIEEIIEKFAQSAERAQKAGFDGVEIHCSHGYLLQEFQSSFANIRDDIYGGNLKNRTRFILSVVKAVKERVGPSYPVWARITAKEFNIKAGINLDESQQLAQWLEKAGVVAINVSATGETTRSPLNMAWLQEGEQVKRPPMAHPYGFLLPLATKIKEKVHIPVMGVGRISPEVGEKAIEQGKVDMVVMGRAFLCDPELPHKLASGDLEGIRSCFGCNECVQRLLGDDDTLHCSLNPVMGRERELSSKKVLKRKRVVIIGGGPAGLEAAEASAINGHEVILLEKNNRLGGHLLQASTPPFKSELVRFINFLGNQVKRLGVKIVLGKEATVNSVLKLKPDSVVVATGATRTEMGISGFEQMLMLDADDALIGRNNVGEVVAIVGGGLVGCDTAEFLSSKGKIVIIVELLDRLSLGIENPCNRQLLERLNMAGVSVVLGAKPSALCSAGLIFENAEGKKELLPCDTVVNATTPKPNKRLYHKLSEAFPEVYIVGDCLRPRGIAEAVFEGYRTGMLI